MSSNSRLISLSGYKGSGKDAVFKELSKFFPQYNFKRLAWGDPLKKEVSEIFGIPMDLLHADEETKNTTETEADIFEFIYASMKATRNPNILSDLFDTLGGDRTLGESLTVREVLQFWGTDVRRAQDPEYWIKQTLPLIDTHLVSTNIIVLTDTRFENELKAIHERQGVSFWLSRKDVDQEETHSSERSLEDDCLFSIGAKGYQTLEETMRDLAMCLKATRNGLEVNPKVDFSDHPLFPHL